MNLNHRVCTTATLPERQGVGVPVIQISVAEIVRDKNGADM
jgi:hypothetical protein